MKYTRWFPILLMLGCGATTPSVVELPLAASATPPVDSAALPVAVDDRQAIYTLVHDAEQAWYEQLDYQRYFSVWTQNGSMIRARSPRTSSYDVVVRRPYFDKTLKFISDKKYPTKGLGVKEWHADIKDDEATFDWISITKAQDTNDDSFFGERYLLRRINGAWRIEQKRYWPLYRIRDGEKTDYGPAYFRDQDKKVESNRGNDRNYLDALVSAWRYREAIDLVRGLTSQSPTDAWLSEMEGFVALMLGEVDEAIKWYAISEKNKASTP